MCMLCNEAIVVAAMIVQSAPVMPTVWERVWKIVRRSK